MYLTMVKNTSTGFGSILRTLIMVASHATRKRDTILYPEQPVPVPPRFRGRIVLT
ncbi:NADH-quinone oxidoreductase subunit I, partial [Mycobacterium tuberculosis]|nr:NADH-quinone oxidoreductase subunit I [Mycobacterium tuberculosis]